MSFVTHFAIYAEEPSKGADFCRNLFGWQIDKAPGIDYRLIKTGATDATSCSGPLTYRAISKRRSWVHYVSVVFLEDSLEDSICSSPALRRSSSAPKDSGAKDRMVCGRLRPREVL
jgi:uncharacterized protein